MSNIIGGVIDFYKGLPSLLPERIVEIPVERIVIKESTMIIGQSRHFVRLAGLSGAVAVAMSAYGAHGKSSSILKRTKLENQFITLLQFCIYEGGEGGPNHNKTVN